MDDTGLKENAPWILSKVPQRRPTLRQVQDIFDNFKKRGHLHADPLVALEYLNERYQIEEHNPVL